MKRARTGRLLSIATSTCAVLLTSTALAQEGTGVRGQLSFTQGLEFTDNPDLSVESRGDLYSSVTNLGFGITSETLTEEFSFSLGTTIEQGFGDASTSEDDLRLSGGDAALGYTRRGGNASLSFTTSFSRNEVEEDFDAFFVDGEFDPDALIVDAGDVERVRVGIALRTGIEGPFGLDLNARGTDVSYVDVTNEDLNDSTSYSVDGTARFRLRPTFAFRVRAGTSVTEERGTPTENETQTFGGLGIEGDLARGLSYIGDVFVDRSETETDDIVTEEEDGIGAEFSMTQLLPTGSIGLALSSRVDTDGRRNQATFSRGVNFPSSQLTISLGLVDQEDTDLEVVGAFGFNRDLARGSLSANVQRSATTDSGDTRLNTTVDLGVRRDLTPLSGLSATFSFGSSDLITDTTEDSTSRATLGLAYQRNLTRDWGLNAGINYTRIEEDDAEDRDARTLFINIGRDFNFGF